MKKIPKKLLDDHIEACRAFWKSKEYNKGLYDKQVETAEALGKAIGVAWYSVLNFFDGIMAMNGIYPDAENDEIYCALHTLGWMEVKDNG